MKLLISDRGWGPGSKFLLVLLAGAFAACMAADFIAPYHYASQNLALGASGPSLQHLLGTDQLGRDILSRLLFGGRISFLVGIIATAVASLIGTVYGMISGMAGGRTDSVMMRIVDIAYSLPFAIFVILLTVFFGRSLWMIFLAIGAVEWLTMARITRGLTLELKSRQFVQAAVSMGQSRTGVAVRHIVPNLLQTAAVTAALTMPSVMLLEAFLSFLGLGVQAPLPSLGSLVKDGAEYMEDAPWLLVFPAVFFSFILLSVNLLGEKLAGGRR